MRGRYLGPAALIGPHGRSIWWVRFGGRAYLNATERLEESRQMKRIACSWTKEDSWMSCLPENCEDLAPQLEPARDAPGRKKTVGRAAWSSQ